MLYHVITVTLVCVCCKQCMKMMELFVETTSFAPSVVLHANRCTNTYEVTSSCWVGKLGEEAGSNLSGLHFSPPSAASHPHSFPLPFIIFLLSLPLSLFTFPSITLMSLFAYPSPSHLTHNTHTYFPLLSPLLPSLSLLSLFPITSGPTLLSSQCFPSREPKLFERMCARRVKSPAPPIVTMVSTYNVSSSLELSIGSNVVYMGMCEVKAAEK